MNRQERIGLGCFMATMLFLSSCALALTVALFRALFALTTWLVRDDGMAARLSDWR